MGASDQDELHYFCHGWLSFWETTHLLHQKKFRGGLHPLPLTPDFLLKPGKMLRLPLVPPRDLLPLRRVFFFFFPCCWEDAVSILAGFGVAAGTAQRWDPPVH